MVTISLLQSWSVELAKERGLVIVHAGQRGRIVGTCLLNAPQFSILRVQPQPCIAGTYLQIPKSHQKILSAVPSPLHSAQL